MYQAGTSNCIPQYVRDVMTRTCSWIYASATQSPQFLPAVHVMHYRDVIISTLASQITGISIVYSTVCTDADQRKYQSSASLVFVRWIHRRPVNSPHKGPVTRKIFQFDDVSMVLKFPSLWINHETCVKYTIQRLWCQCKIQIVLLSHQFTIISVIAWSYSMLSHFVYAPSQWETTLQRNVISHWLGAYKEWALRVCRAGGAWRPWMYWRRSFVLFDVVETVVPY